MEVLKLWVKVDNQFKYHTIAEIEGVVTAGIKTIQVQYLGTGDDEGIWGGWYKTADGDYAGEYTGFGANQNIKNVGYLRFSASDGFNYVLDIDITETDGKWSFVSKLNDEVYTSNSRPSESGGTFTSESADPSLITLTDLRFHL